MTKEDTAGNVHRKLYGKSDKVNALENRNDEFQGGYWTGVDSLGYDARKVIEEEHELRKEVGDDLGSGFEEWCRGLWAARSQLIICPIKKRKKYGKSRWGKSRSPIQSFRGIGMKTLFTISLAAVILTGQLHSKTLDGKEVRRAIPVERVKPTATPTPVRRAIPVATPTPIAAATPTDPTLNLKSQFASIPLLKELTIEVPSSWWILGADWMPSLRQPLKPP